MLAPRRPLFVTALLALAATSVCGCSWMDGLRGDGFQPWNQSLGGSLRGKTDASRPSGFFTDSRSDQIEQNLGGGF